MLKNSSKFVRMFRKFTYIYWFIEATQFDLIFPDWRKYLFTDGKVNRVPMQYILYFT